MGRRKKKRRGGADIELHLRRVEIALAYDGPLRGAPEPVLLFGVYRVADTDVTLLSRRAIALRVGSGVPETIEIEDGHLGVHIPSSQARRMLVLAIALEEDGGEGVRRMYAELEAPPSLEAWAVDAVMPRPLSLLEWARQEPPPAPATTRVHLVDTHGDLRDQKLGDDWIGAAIVHVPPQRGRRSERRLRFASEDGKNDWTAVLEVRRV